MACYYRIQLPDGGFITIPSSVNIIEKNEKIVSDINDYYSSEQDEFHEKYKELLRKKFKKDIDYSAVNETFEKENKTALDKYNDLKNSIKDDFSITSLNLEQIGKIIRNSNPELLISDINKKILDEVTQDNFEISMKKWIYNWKNLKDFNPSENFNSKNGFPKTLKQLLTIVSKKINPEYFQELSYIDIVGKSSINEERHNYTQKIDILANEYQVSTIIPESVKGVLDLLSDVDLSDQKILFGINATGTENDTLVIPPSDKNNGFIFYNNNNDLSLFLSVFKYLSSSIDWNNKKNTKALKEIITEWNEKNKNSKNKELNLKHIDLRSFSPVKFFTGEFKKENDVTSFKEASFHEMIDSFSIDSIEKIVDLIIDNIDTKKTGKLKINIKKTFKFLNSKKYGKSVFSTVTQAMNDHDEQIIRNNQYKSEIISKKYAKLNTSGTRDLHYNSSEIITNSGKNAVSTTFLELKDKINFGKDLVKVEFKDPQTKKTGSLYVIVTNLSYDEKGIWVNGLSLVNNQPKVSKYLLKLDTNDRMTAVYRTFESEETPITIDNTAKLNDAVIVKSEDGEYLSSKVVKRFAQLGSYVIWIDSKGVKRNGSVIGVFPGKLKVYGQKFLLNYDRIIEINTTKLTEDDKKDWRDVVFKNKLSISENAGNFAGENDVVKFKDGNKVRINKVIDSDKDNLYIIINTDSKGSYVKKIPRSVVTNAFIQIDSIGITNEILQALSDTESIQTDNSIRENKYSFSEDVNDAKDGDILIIQNPNDIGNLKFYKLLDKRTMKVIQRIDTSEYSVQILNKNEVTGVYTTNDISGNNALDIIRINNRKIYVSEDKGKDNVIYLVPENTYVDNLTLLDSLYFNVGIVIDSNEYKNKPDKYKDFKDVTKLVKTLVSRKLNRSINSLFFEVIPSDSKNDIHKRHIDDLVQINKFKLLPASEKTKALQRGAYLRLEHNKTLGRKIYRISEDLGDSVLMEYSISSFEGEIKTIRKKILKSELVENISQFFLIKGNSKIQNLIVKTQKLELKEKKQDKRTKEQLRESFVSNIQNAFKESNINIEVKTVTEKSNFKSGQKAKIQNGNIIINKNNSTEQDVVHEFLHVFMIGLKYYDSEQYSNLLLNFINNKLDENQDFLKENGIESRENLTLDTIEELLVDVISKVLIQIEDLDISTVENLEKALIYSFEKFNLELGSFNISTDLYKILNTDMKTLLKIESSKVYTDVLIYEAGFREWVQDKIRSGNLEINCI